MQRPRTLNRKPIPTSPLLTLCSPISHSITLTVKVEKQDTANKPRTMRNLSQVHRILKQPSLILVKNQKSDSLHQTVCTNTLSGLQQNLVTDRDSIDMSFLNEPPLEGTQLAWKSPYRNIFTAWFPYPEVCDLTRDSKNLAQIPKQRMTYQVRGQVPFRAVIQAFEAADFQSGIKWNILWGMAPKETLQKMSYYQKVNHFPGCWSIGRKDNLWLNLSKSKRRYPKDYNFIPNTYLLSSELDRFELIREGAPKSKLWIKKPVAAARGIGIKLITKNSKLTQTKNCLIMDYISRPHLINNLKYDLRVYVCVTSVDPLRVYMYQDGLVRFATEEYSLSKKNIKKKYIHLTNFSVNKNAPNYVPDRKWSHKEYRDKLTELNIDHEALFQQIEDIVLKTVISFESLLLDSRSKELSILGSEHKGNYFELYGFDILVDQNLKPWVLEVNVSPSLNSSSELDARLKTTLISDMLHLVGIPCGKRYKQQKAPSFSRNIHDIESCTAANFKSKISYQDIDILLQTLEEQLRVGHFKCLYPQTNMDQYDQYFEYPRFHNKLIQKYYQEGRTWQF